MEFQRKIERLCAMRCFNVPDRCILHMLLWRLSDVTALDALQWYSALRALLSTYAWLCAMWFVEPRAPQRAYQAALARGMRRWWFVEQPLRVAPTGREACVNRLMLFMADELEKERGLLRYRPVRETLDALGHNGWRANHFLPTQPEYYYGW